MKITTYPSRISDLIKHYEKEKEDVDNDLKKRGVNPEDAEAFDNLEESTDLGMLLGADNIYSVVIEDLKKIIK